MPIRKRPTTDQLYWRFQYKGRTYEKSMETASRREATRRGTDWEVETRARLDAEEAPTLYPTLAVLRDLDITRAKSDGNNPRYLTHGLGIAWKRLIEFFPGDTRTVTHESVKAYRQYRESRGIRGQTIRKELICLKRGLRLARIKIEGSDDPAFWPKIRAATPDAKLAVKPHDAALWQAWFAELKGSCYAVAMFALLTGLRWGELYRATPDDLIEVEGGFTVLKVKEKVKRVHPRRVVLSPLALLLVDLGCLPFPHIKHETARRSAAKRVGAVGNITLRDCRGAFASAAGSVVQSKIVNLIMGHSGVPARYFFGDYVEMARAALAVQRWITGTAAGGIEKPHQVDKWTSL